MRIVVAAALVLLTIPPAAAGGREPVKPGIAAATSRRLSALHAERQRRRVAERLKARAELAGRLDGLTERERPSLQAAWAKQRAARTAGDRLEQWHRQAAEALKTETQRELRDELKRRATLFSRLRRDLEPGQQAAWQASKVNTRRLNERVVNLLRGFFQGEVINLGPGSFLGRADDQPPAEQPPAEACFQKPFALGRQATDEGGAAVNGEADADEDEGTVLTYAHAYLAGGASAEAAVGCEVTVPAGFTRLTITVDYDRYHHLSGLALAGACGSSTAHQIEVIGEDGADRVNTSNVIDAWAAALWSYDEDEIGDHREVATFRIPDNGGEYQVYAGSRSDAWAAAGGIGDGYVSDQVLEICVEAHN